MYSRRLSLSVIPVLRYPYKRFLSWFRRRTPSIAHGGCSVVSNLCGDGMLNKQLSPAVPGKHAAMKPATCPSKVPLALFLLDACCPLSPCKVAALRVLAGLLEASAEGMDAFRVRDGFNVLYHALARGDDALQQVTLYSPRSKSGTNQ